MASDNPYVQGSMQLNPGEAGNRLAFFSSGVLRLFTPASFGRFPALYDGISLSLWNEALRVSVGEFGC